MPYLIDGNNLIGAIRVIDIRDAAAREKMTRMLAAYQRAKNNSVTVVYDGPPPGGVRGKSSIGGLKIIYAGPDTDADTRIRKILDRAREPASYVVVSSDKQVYSYARWRGAKAMRVMPFYKDLQQTLERAGRMAAEFDALNDNEVDEWIRYLGLEDWQVED
ncbi:MAG TPA: NYN domain-containing protein [Acidobacteriota bacterium]|nr:NYN domain-containing protein [Acidobacteriota bacterium]